MDFFCDTPVCDLLRASIHLDPNRPSRLPVFNHETNGSVLFKDTLSFGMSNKFAYSFEGKTYKGKEEGTTYSLPLSPWIMSKGKYHILIERNNFLREDENRVMSIRYTIE